jgi:hypothetical protein
VLRVTFICGNLESGKDGIGDYTRCLATELIRQGHQATIIAIEDRYCKLVMEEEQDHGGTSVSTLRLSRNLPLAARKKQLIHYLDEQKTAHISLQYGVFSYHPKGLPWRWHQVFQSLQKERYWHINFHELWLGIPLQSSFKEKIWGRMQRLLILDLLKQLKPKSIQTHTAVYYAALQQHCSIAYQLPLFSNIQKVPLVAINLSPAALKIIVFGTIYSSEKATAFFQELSAYSISNSQPTTIYFIGRNGSQKWQWIRLINQHAAIVYQDIGALHVAKISSYLQQADLGITTTPFPLVGKSGVVASYLLHALPVLSVASEWTSRYTDASETRGVATYQTGQLTATLDQLLFSSPKGVTLSAVASRFADQCLQTVHSNNSFAQ